MRPASLAASGERARLVGGVADHEGDAFFGFRPRRRGETKRDEGYASEGQASERQFESGFHDGSLCRKSQL